MPSTTALKLPNKFDPRVFDDGIKRIPAFLHNADHAREREMTNGNGDFFFIVAEQWMALASLQYVFLINPEDIVQTVKSGLKDFLTALELVRPIEPLTALDYFSAAVAVNDMHGAHFITGVPDEVIGFLDDPDSPVPVVVANLFALLADQDTEMNSSLEYLHGLLFEYPCDVEFLPVKAELDNLYYLVASLVVRDADAFDKHLRERYRIRVEALERDADEYDIPPVIDWTALGLLQFARDRNMAVSSSHVYVPAKLLELARNPLKKL